MVAGVRAMFSDRWQAGAGRAPGLGPEALAHRAGHGLGPVVRQPGRGEESVREGPCPALGVVVGPPLGLWHPEAEIDRERGRDGRDRAAGAPGRIGVVEIAGDQPERRGGLGKAAFDEVAHRFRLEPPDRPGGRRIRPGGLEVADEEREPPDLDLEAVAPEDRQILEALRRVEAEIAGTQGGVACHAVQGGAAHHRHVEPAAVVPRKADAVRIGRNARGHEHAVVEMIERGGVEDFLEREHVGPEVPDHRGGQAAVEGVEIGRAVAFARVPRPVEPVAAIRMPQPEPLNVEGRDPHARSRSQGAAPAQDGG